MPLDNPKLVLHNYMDLLDDVPALLAIITDCGMK